MCQKGKPGFSKGKTSETCAQVSPREDPCCSENTLARQQDCQGDIRRTGLSANVIFGVVGGLLSLLMWVYCRSSTFRRRMDAPAPNQQMATAAAFPASAVQAVQPVAQAVPMQQSMLLSVPCPQGAGPGSMIMVQGPAGPMQVQVPDGVVPGQVFQFQAPAAPAAPQAVAIAQPVGQPVGQQAVAGQHVAVGIPM